MLAQKSSVLVSPLKKGARAERDSVMERARKEEREQREGPHINPKYLLALSLTLLASLTLFATPC